MRSSSGRFWPAKDCRNCSWVARATLTSVRAALAASRRWRPSSRDCCQLQNSLLALLVGRFQRGGPRGQVLAFGRALGLLGRQAVDLENHGLDFLGEQAGGVFQGLELALARGDGDLPRAQFGLRLLQAGLQLRLLAQERALLPAGVADAFLQGAGGLAQFGDLIFAAQDGGGRPAVAVAVQIAAGEDAVPVEQIARWGDEVVGPVGLAPGSRRRRKVGRDQRLAQQPPQQRLDGGFGLNDAHGAQRAGGKAAVVSDGARGVAVKRRQMEGGDAGAAGFVGAQVLDDLARGFRLFCQY